MGKTAKRYEDESHCLTELAFVVDKLRKSETHEKFRQLLDEHGLIKDFDEAFQVLITDFNGDKKMHQTFDAKAKFAWYVEALIDLLYSNQNWSEIHKKCKEFWGPYHQTFKETELALKFDAETQNKDLSNAFKKLVECIDNILEAARDSRDWSEFQNFVCKKTSNNEDLIKGLAKKMHDEALQES